MLDGKKIIFIAGYGRSGSTILDILLSQQDEITGVGELINIFQSGWVVNRDCTCGKKTSDCFFWNDVKDIWKNNSNYSIEKYIIQQKKYRKVASIPYLFWLRFFPSKSYLKFKKDTELLYEALFKISGCNILVDSSKDVAWLYILKSMKVDLQVIHLVRDGRSVLKSMRRLWRKSRKPKTTFSIAASWFSNNIMVELLKKHTTNIFIKYENLISMPEVVLDNLSDTFNINLNKVKAVIAEKTPLSKGHMVAGNPIRLENGLIFKRENASKNEVQLSKKDEYMFNTIGYFLLKKYKYL